MAHSAQRKENRMSNVDRWTKRAAEIAAETSFGETTYLQLKEGPNVIRILPPPPGREDFWLEYQKSYNVGPNGKVIVRPDQFNLPDPVADEIARLKTLTNEKGEPDQAALKRADMMKAKKRAAMFAIARAEEAKGAQLFDTNMIVLRDILSIMTDADYGDITDPEKGIDITINYTPKSGPKTFPKWQIVPRRNSSPLGFPELLTEDLFDKHRVGQPSEFDYIAACLAGTEQQFIESRRNSDGGSSAPASAPQSTPAPQSAAPAGSENDAIQAELDRVRAKQQASAPPAPPTAPAAPAAPGTPAELLNADWWAVIDGASTQVKGSKIQELVAAGHGEMQVMPYPSGEWSTASAAGFIAGPPPPPPSSQVGADLEKALG